MEAAAQPALPPVRWSLKKIYVTTAAVICLLVGCAPALYNSDLLVLLALGLLGALLVNGTLAVGFCLKNLLRHQRQRSLAWLLLAGLSFAGWWVSSRLASEAMKLPLSPDDPALVDLLRGAFAPYFSS